MLTNPMRGMPILGDAVRGKEPSSASELAETAVSVPSDIAWLLTDWAVTCLAIAAATSSTTHKRRNRPPPRPIRPD